MPEAAAAGPDRTHAREAGFTLIELLVVLAILGTLTAVALPRLGLGDGPRLQASAQALATELRLLRDEAIRRGVSTVLTPTEAGYVLRPSGRTALFPAQTVLAIAPAASVLLPPGKAEAAITFFPDGSSTGGLATLRHGNLVATISVRGLDGRVRIRD